jgi:chromosome segregation ATPase
LGRAAELELELASLKTRHAALEQDTERMRTEFAERERFVAEQSVAGMKGEMQKLRDLMRERDDSMRSLEARIKERELFFSPEEHEREKKRVEAAAQYEAKRQSESLERQLKELEARLAARGAEAEAAARTIREKDDLIKLLSDREDRASGVAKERDDKLSEAGEELRKLREELAATAAREQEAGERVKQKNAQLAELGQQQASLTQELAKARAAAARVGAGEAAGAAASEQLQAVEAELAKAREQANAQRAETARVQDELIAAQGRAAQAEAKAVAAQRSLDESQAQLTDLADEKARLARQVDELMEKHARLAEAERQAAGAAAKLEAMQKTEGELRERLSASEGETVRLKQERLDLVAARQEAVQKLQDLEADYSVLKQSRDATFDWEARYKSQVEDFEALRRQNAELKQVEEALQMQVAATSGGIVDEGQLAYAKAGQAVLGEVVGGMMDGVNSAVSLLRRNSDVLKGYVHDCGLLANCVRRINYTLLEPDQQRMVRELVDETQPEIIVGNMESIGEENAEATARARKLIADYLDAMRTDEEGAELERCFARSQGFVQAVDPSSPVKVKFGGATPPLAASQPEGVLFAFALMREARGIAVDEDQAPTIRVDAQGSTVTVIVSPVHPSAKDRYRETIAGGGDARSRYIVGFARQAAQGRVDVKDLGNAAALFVTLNGART